MVQDQKIEKVNINVEQVNSSEQSSEKSLDSTKKERVGEIKVSEKNDSDNIIAQQVVIPDIQPQQKVVTSSEIIHKKVEGVLSDGMDNVFLSLDSATQRSFKIKGEEVSAKITNLLLETKIKVAEITKLILEWLRIIPKVNKHYLEQEAKIKTEKILKIKNE